MSDDFRAVVVAHGVAGVVAVLVGRPIGVEHPIAVAFWARAARSSMPIPRPPRKES